VAPVLVFALSASSHLEIRCALTGLLTPNCCPEADQPLVHPQRYASISERNCCERTIVATAKLPVASSKVVPQKVPPAMARLSPPLRGEAALSYGAQDLPGNSPWFAAAAPPYLLTHAFLI